VNARGYGRRVSVRELVVLGTASQVPTRHRNHNGYLLRWDGEGILFDPGEGTQRQLMFAGVPASAITKICITHFHGDHCLGLPGIIQRLSLDRVAHPIDVYFPAAGLPFVERLVRAAIFEEFTELRLHSVESDGVVAEGDEFTLHARSLDHGPPTLGWRLEEPAGRRMLPERLDAAGIRGPDVGRLQHDGVIDARGRVVELEEVSEIRPGQRFAFVMDTRPCDAAAALAAGVDLLVCESTFLSAEADLASAYGHMTAADAGRLATNAGSRMLVLTHFSQRHPDEGDFISEAAAVCSEVVAASDLQRIPVPRRRETATG